MGNADFSARLSCAILAAVSRRLRRLFQILFHPLFGQSQYQSFSVNTSVYTVFIAFSCHFNEQECLKGKLLDVPSHAPWPPPFVPSNAKASLCILHIQVSTSMHIAEQAIAFCMHHIAQCSLVYAITIEDAA